MEPPLPPPPDSPIDAVETTATTSTGAGVCVGESDEFNLDAYCERLTGEQLWSNGFANLQERFPGLEHIDIWQVCKKMYLKRDLVQLDLWDGSGDSLRLEHPFRIIIIFSELLSYYAVSGRNRNINKTVVLTLVSQERLLTLNCIGESMSVSVSPCPFLRFLIDLPTMCVVERHRLISIGCNRVIGLNPGLISAPSCDHPGHGRGAYVVKHQPYYACSGTVPEVPDSVYCILPEHTHADQRNGYLNACRPQDAAALGSRESEFTSTCDHAVQDGNVEN